MGTIYPCSDHYLPYPDILNKKKSYFTVIVGTTTQEAKLLENF